MITCTLGERKYSVDYISGRALREMDDANKMYIAILNATNAGAEENTPENDIEITQALDTMVKWFCVLFNNQFTPDEVYDTYPVDSLLSDIVYALLSVRNAVTSTLSDFPMKAAQAKSKKNPKP